MRKTTGVICFERKDGRICIKNVYFAHRGGQVCMTSCFSNCYGTLTEVYAAVLKVAKNNDFKISYYEEFDARLYDIMWIDCGVGTSERYYTR